MAYANPGDERAKACKRRYYEKNRSRYYENNRRKRVALGDWLIEFKTGKPCVDCGKVYPYYVYDLDQRDPSQKRDIVSRAAATRSWSRLKTEIEKRDLVCSNCRRIRTHSAKSVQRCTLH